VTFDHSGLYMAVGGADARVYGVKQDWEVVKTFPDMPKKVRAELVSNKGPLMGRVRVRARTCRGAA